MTQISIGLPYSRLANGSPQFYVKNQAGSETTWFVDQVFRDGDAATVRLASHDTTGRPVPGDMVIASFVDPTSGDQHVLGPVPVSPPSAGPSTIANGTFAAWNKGVPVAWTPKAAPDASYFIEPIEGDANGVRASIAAVSNALSTAPQISSLEQLVRLTKPRLRVRLRPYQDCRIRRTRAGNAVVSLGGIGVRNVMGAEAFFCVSPVRHSLKFSHVGGGAATLIVVPGRIGSWNDVTLDLRSTWPHLGRERKEFLVTIQVVAAIGAVVGTDAPWVTVDVASIATP